METLCKLYLELAKTPGVGDAARTHRDIAHEKRIAELEAERDEEQAMRKYAERRRRELSAEVARLREALRSVNGAVGHAIAEHLRDPHRAVYEEGDFDRRLLKMSEAVQRIARDALAEAEEGDE